MDKQGTQVAVYESFVCKFGHWDNSGHHPTIGLFEDQTSIVQKDQWSSKSTSLPNIKGSTGPRGSSMPRHMMGSQAVQRGISVYNPGVEFGRESGNPVWNPSGAAVYTRTNVHARVRGIGRQFNAIEPMCVIREHTKEQ